MGFWVLFRIIIELVLNETFNQGTFIVSTADTKFMDRKTVYKAMPEDSDNQILCHIGSQALSETLFHLCKFTSSFLFSPIRGQNKIFLELEIFL
jgi:hypothetical protein